MVPIGVRKIRALRIDDHSLFHIVAHVVTVVAFDATEDRCLQSAFRREMTFEGEAVAEARSLTSALRRLLLGIGEPREVVDDVMTGDNPAMFARRPYCILEKPCAVDELDARSRSHVECVADFF